MGGRSREPGGQGGWRRWRAVMMLVLSLNMALAQSASANVNGELNDFFNDLGGAGNATGPVAYEGQSAGYYTAGGVWSRFPQRSVNPVSIQLPGVKAGCGGIDLFGGSFSFINGDEFIAMLKGVASNALGFAFQLAIKSISPQIASTVEELSQKIQQMNQFNMNSCEMAQNLVGGLWGQSDTMSAYICNTIGNSQGIFSDWAKSRHECGNGKQTSTIAANSDPTIPAGPYNFTWHALTTSYPAMDEEMKEYLMTLTGTIISVPGADDSAGPTYDFRGGMTREMIQALLDGTATRMLDCDETEKCLNPTEKDVTIGTADALKPKIGALIERMMGKIQTNTALDAQEIGLLGGSSLPLYKILTVSAASQFGGIAPSEIENLAELVALDMVQTIAREHFRTVQQAAATFQNANQEALTQWRNQMGMVSQELEREGNELTGRMQRVQMTLDRTMFLERTIMNSISPQMGASLGFAQGLSAAPAQ